MAEPRTFQVESPTMHGDDVRNWQNELIHEFHQLDINCPVEVDGYYGVQTRAYTASLCHALGMNAGEQMKDGLTPELRTRIRHRQLYDFERDRFTSEPYVEYRRALRKRWGRQAGGNGRVHKPVDDILQHSWGYHPPVHDGVDVICKPDVPIYAMVKCRVVDVRSSGWWGKGAPSDPNLKAKGDGIIQVEVLDDVGPFTKGHHVCYGHAEKAVVKVGDVVEAGHQLGHAGFANAWHVHLMHNDGNVGNRGIGNLNPEPLLAYTIEHG
jgi:murein DD-endopeptidase MepM/ murein hydrolase activator NlpD